MAGSKKEGEGRNLLSQIFLQHLLLLSFMLGKLIAMPSIAYQLPSGACAKKGAGQLPVFQCQNHSEKLSHQLLALLTHCCLAVKVKCLLEYLLQVAKTKGYAAKLIKLLGK